MGAVMDNAPAMTGTLTPQRGSVLPAGQSLPGSGETTVLARILPPVSGSSTVTRPSPAL
jgi:hypothetical protein